VEALGGTERITLGADKNYDTRGFVEELREMTVTPHVAQNDTNYIVGTEMCLPAARRALCTGDMQLWRLACRLVAAGE
jgi:predicted NBD/HSP70 family sugar kinase